MWNQNTITLSLKTIDLPSLAHDVRRPGASDTCQPLIVFNQDSVHSLNQ